MVAAHGVTLRGPQVSGKLAAPVILQRNDEDFIGAVLDELGGPHGLEEVLKPEKVARAQDVDHHLKLFAPIHRAFHVVLVEAICDVFGEPRFDPAEIESAGLVIRRCVRLQDGEPRRGNTPRVPPRDDRDRLEGWRQAGKRFRAWVPFVGAEANLDPDPARRAPALRSGHPKIDSELVRYAPGVNQFLETVVPLFIAPPEVCQALGRTVLYGMLPTASSDLTEVPGEIDYTQNDVRGIASPYLFSAAQLSFAPASGQTTPAYVAREDVDALRREATFFGIYTAVQQATFQFSAFDLDSTIGRELFDLWNHQTLSFPTGTRRMGDWLSDASKVFVIQDPDDGPESLMMPIRWPTFPAALRQQLLAKMQISLRDRVVSVRPQIARFDDSTRTYRIRAFIRLREEGGCRHGPVWSDYSEQFTIAPWYDSAGRPPVKIELPDFDKDFLKNLKPSVAFAVPPKMLNMLNNLKLKKLMDGEKPSEDGTTLQWICGFNLLIIFIIAFMLMFIFLILFNIIFGWLFWAKICIPIPGRSPSPPSPANA
jgi:hypothetical protein